MIEMINIRNYYLNLFTIIISLFETGILTGFENLVFVLFRSCEKITCQLQT